MRPETRQCCGAIFPPWAGTHLGPPWGTTPGPTPGTVFGPPRLELRQSPVCGVSSAENGSEGEQR